FRLDSGKRRSRKSSNEASRSTRQYWPVRTSHKYLPSSTKRVSRSASLRFSQARISSIFVSTKSARREFSLGDIGGSLVRKLVKHTKVLRSWSTDQGSIHQRLFAQAKPNVRTGTAGILGKANSTVRQKLGRFDLLNR